MSCISIKLEDYANGDLAIELIIDAIMANTAATQRPFVKRDRSSNGRTFQGMICFFKDTISKSDLKVARDIARGNSDVTFGIQFPLDFTDDIELLTAGATLTDDKLVGNPSSSEIPFVTVNPDDLESGLRVSADGEGTGGSGKALELVDLDTTTNSTDHKLATLISLKANEVDSLSDFTAYSVSFDHKRAKTWTVPGDTPDRTSNVIAIKSQALVNNQVTIRINDIVNVYVFQYFDSLGAFQNINTGVAWDGSYKKMKLEVRTDGTWTFDLDNGAYTVTVDLGVTLPTPDVRIQAVVSDRYNTSRTVTQESMFIDNVVYQVKDGTLI